MLTIYFNLKENRTASTQNTCLGVFNNRIANYFPKVLTPSCLHSDRILLVIKSLPIVLHNYIFDLQGGKRGMLLSNNLNLYFMFLRLKDQK